MEIKHENTANGGRFYFERTEDIFAELTYKQISPDTLIIDHTEVNEHLRGEGNGHKLVSAAIAFMRKNDLKAIPQCPFVKSVFDKKGQEYNDVRA